MLQKTYSSLAILLVSVIMGGCLGNQAMRPEWKGADLPLTVPETRSHVVPRKFVAEGLKALSKGDLEKASKAFNAALKTDIKNSHLQFLNGLTYHLRARAGDPGSYRLAEEGYKLALRFDRTNWEARYYLAQLALDRRQFGRARQLFADAVYDRDDDPGALYNLATAAYYAGDPVTADAALQQIVSTRNAHSPKVMRAAAITLASLDRPAKAHELWKKYASQETDPWQRDYVMKRIADWGRFHRENRDLQMARAGASNPFAGEDDVREEPEDEDTDTRDRKSFDEDFVETQMVVVDVVMIGSEEDTTRSMGVNLLSGLQIQFGDPWMPTPGLSWSKEKITDRKDPTQDVNMSTFTRLISIPAITYSLNIANTLSGRNEIIARPTLVALSGQTSEFFSGTDISAAAVSGGSGDSVSVEKQVGVKLSVTPEFLGRDRVRLKVEAERTFLTTPSSSVVFQFRLDTSMTQVSANVVMRFGETLVLSGLMEKELEDDNDSVPFLEDIPLIQYLFSQKSKRDYRKSVLILLTPRKPHRLAGMEKQEEKNADSLEVPGEMERFERRFAHWFRFHPDRGNILYQLKNNDMFREFRTGDFLLYDWTEDARFKEHIRRTLEFLYY
jgi:general secretion pathway protein D